MDTESHVITSSNNLMSLTKATEAKFTIHEQFLIATT